MEMKNQFILNPSCEIVEETVALFAKGDGYVNIDSVDIHSIMDNASNALILTSVDAAGEGRVEKIIEDIKSRLDITEGYAFNTAESVIISIEYPKSEEITIDECVKIMDSITAENPKAGLIWGATINDESPMRIKLIATNLKRA